MKHLIKEIRRMSGMSQEQFARQLGTTPISINRWENGKALPNGIAQKQLFEFCRKHGINIERAVIDSFECKKETTNLILYHGSRHGIAGAIAPISREECDFGKGFYMGTTTLQPLTLVCAEEKPVFYTTELDLTGLKVLEIEMNMDWAMLIAYYRKQMNSAIGTALYEKYAQMAQGYDIIVGYIANDRMYTVLSDFFAGTMTDVALMKCLSALDLGKQYVALTQKACDQITILVERTIEPLEQAILQELSGKRRKEGISLADEIRLKYRREGKFFDEIVGQ